MTALAPSRPTFKKIVTKSRALPNRVLFHAVQKWGKTSFAAQAPKPIFLCTKGEDGLDTLIKSGQLPDTPHFEDTATTWNHLLMAIEELLIEPHDYKTFVLDTINGAARSCMEHVIDMEFDGKQANYESYGRGTKVLVTEFLKLRDKLDQLREMRGMAIILLAHSQVKTFSNPEGANYDRWEPVLPKEIWAIVDRWVDMILFGNYVVYADKEKKNDTKAKATGGQDRVICTEWHAAYDAGNRYGLSPEIECGDSAQEAWANFIAELHPNRKKG